MKKYFYVILLGGSFFTGSLALGNGNVYVSRFWHNHQPIYWPEWNGNGSETERVQFAWDSIVLKGTQQYSTSVGHPENDLNNIFGIDDRKNAYQSGPRNSLAGLNSAAGFAMSYSGSLMDNVRNLGNAGQLGYSSSWWDGNREASNLTTPGGSPRLDIVGFTYHHSLGAVLPKPVFRKELQVYKEVWWKGWKGIAKPLDDSAHTKGFFPTEMAFSRHMIDVLVDEGYEWSIVASHHLSRTCPTYFDQFDIENNNYGIFSSPPNQADQLGPSPTTGWWYSEPNPGNAAWNVSPHAYQLQKAKYVNPETGAEKSLLLVPSDDVLSYRYGYASEGISKIQSFISPFATDPSRPVMVMPSTDGDNAWGGGSSSWFEATPQLFNDSGAAGYNQSTPQDFVNAHNPANIPMGHIEDGAWIFPESDYGSPYFLKWVEPPVTTNTATRYPGTMVDMETPGFALKFFSWSPVMAGANWCETAEQIWTGLGGTVANYKIQGPYDWFGGFTSPNIVERAWHIYLCGLDSGFNYYGGLGNDDEAKPSLATRRAVEMLNSFMATNLHNDATGPTIFKPQRFPYNPGGYTFGWFNSVPGEDTSYLKEMPSEFYIWTHIYDVSGVTNATLKVRIDNDGTNPIGSNQNETFAGGGEVGAWINIPLTMRVLPNTQATLNAAASNGQIDFFPEALSPEIADYYFAKITDASVPNFRGKLLDYYIESHDGNGNLRTSDIQHVYVIDDGGSSGPQPAVVSWTPDSPTDCPASTLDVIYEPGDGVLSNSSPIYVNFTDDEFSTISSQSMTEASGEFSHSIPIADAVTNVIFYFSDGASIIDNNSNANWNVAVRDCPVPSSATLNPTAPDGCGSVTLTYDPGTDLLADDDPVVAFLGYNDFSSVVPTTMGLTGGVWECVVNITPGTEEINVAFRNNDSSDWDNNGGADWTWPVTGCVEPFDPDACAIEATPMVTADPATPAHQNNTGDNFDFDTIGGSLDTYTQGGFGSFGDLYVNVDDSALYIGGVGVNPSGGNNVLAIFLGLDTLSKDLVNLWSLNGSPDALDNLHNVAFTEGMDLAILIGDEYGDGTYTNFTVTSGYDHGQGIFDLGPGGFIGVPGAELSQFDGAGTTPTTSDDDDAGDRETERWEARIPWSSLNATNYHDLGELWIGGLILSDIADGVDRYLSGNLICNEVTAVDQLDQNSNYGTGFITVTPISVCLPHLDGDEDGLLNSYELKYFGGAGAANPVDDDDNDGLSNAAEQHTQTNPTNDMSTLELISVNQTGPDTLLEWSSVGGVTYRVEYNEGLTIGSTNWTILGSASENDVADGIDTTEMLMDTNGPPNTRFYRVVVP